MCLIFSFFFFYIILFAVIFFQTSNREITKLIIELIRNKLRLCPGRSIGLNIDDQIPHIRLLYIQV